MTVIDFPLQAELDPKAREFLISSLDRSYRTSRLEITGDTLMVAFQEQVSPEAFQEQMDKLLYICKSMRREVLYENKSAHAGGGDPMPHLLACGDVIKIADGLFVYQGTFWKVFQGLHEYVKKWAAKYHAVEQEYPALWPVELYKEINYFKEFPQQVILATAVQDSHQARSAFARRYDAANDYEAVDMTEGMAPARYGLQSAVCDVCYYALRSTRTHHNTVYTTYNKVFRNERSKTDSLDRLLAFSVRDIMFVGAEDFVLSSRQQIIEETREFLGRLDLDCRLETANDPFFSNDAAIKTVFQSAAQLKYELLAELNHCGQDLAVGSINLHLDFFGRAFDIRLPDGGYVHSACLGIGFERLAYALYCQYGHDVDAWPGELKELLGLG